MRTRRPPSYSGRTSAREPRTSWQLTSSRKSCPVPPLLRISLSSLIPRENQGRLFLGRWRDLSQKLRVMLTMNNRQKRAGLLKVKPQKKAIICSEEAGRQLEGQAMEAQGQEELRVRYDSIASLKSTLSLRSARFVAGNIRHLSWCLGRTYFWPGHSSNSIWS